MDIEQRLAKLERQNRWMRRGLVAMALVGVIGLCAGMQNAAPQSIRAREFLVVDPAGVTRGTFGISGENIGLTLRNLDGTRNQVVVANLRGEGRLVVFNDQQEIIWKAP